MKIPEWIETARAESNYVVANTPSFLVRRFKEDKASFLLSQSLSEPDLLKLFASSAGSEPTSLRELVTPYLCLVALSLKPDVKYLRDATSFTPHTNYKWLRSFTRILIDEFRPTSVVRVNAARPAENQVLVNSDAAPTSVVRVNAARPAENQVLVNSDAAVNFNSVNLAAGR
jgi:hypothetical protein